MPAYHGYRRVMVRGVATACRAATLVTWLLSLGGCEPQPAHRTDAEFFPMPGGQNLPFSEAVRVGDMLYLSGQLGTDSTGKLVPGGIGPETRQALDNIAAALTRHGSSMDKVVKCTVMLADVAPSAPAASRSAPGWSWSA
jgi:enamine deaminase RidA (YjgF/YER057c/UK114 family)